MQDNNTNRFYKGLNVDISPLDYKDGEYKFALNAVNKNEDGSTMFLSNEEGNDFFTDLPDGYVPIGKIYTGNNSAVIFSVNSKDNTSEIGLFNTDLGYNTIVNDKESTPENRLNFKISHQISGVYRLRRGCERTVYFTDNLNKPRYFNLDRLYEFKDSSGKWKSQLFDLQKTYETIPNFRKIEVLNSGGFIKPGSYNFSIQYLDSSLNPTEFMTVSNIVKIYNDSTTDNISNINGSINSEADYLKYPATNKSINIELDNLDKSYPFYRVAVIECNSGSGLITRVSLSAAIPVSNTVYTYTGNNDMVKGSLEDIAMFTDYIQKAYCIEQLENRLIIGNTQGSDLNFCNLQKYASRIQADCITKDVQLSSIYDKDNPKNPIQDVSGLGYMPGEIYSFGIQYVFEDNTVSPVYHIPGKNNDKKLENKTYTKGKNVYPMNNTNNTISTRYVKRTCSSNSYWGLDCEGVVLEGKEVRHHRFPLRSEIGLKLVDENTKNILGQQEEILYQLEVGLDCEILLRDEKGTKPPFFIKIEFKNNDIQQVLTKQINPVDYIEDDTTQSLEITQSIFSEYYYSDKFTDIKVSFENSDGTYTQPLNLTINTGNHFQEILKDRFKNGVRIFCQTVETKRKYSLRNYSTQVLGIRFSNINKPSLEETGGKQVIGYYIVRNERTENDKTVIDSGVFTQTTLNNTYISSSLLNPKVGEDKISKNVYGIINPEFKFNRKEYTNFDKIIQEGYFDVIANLYGKVNYDDVFPGTTYNKEEKHHKDNDDAGDVDHSPTSRGLDGWSFNLLSRDNIVKFVPKKRVLLDNKDNIQKVFYLDALGNQTVEGTNNEIYNASADNKTGIIQFKQSVGIPVEEKFPYVIFYRNNSNAYSNFIYEPYYRETQNISIFNNDSDSPVDIFNGDSYVSSVRYVNSLFYDNRPSLRSFKKSLWQYIVGGFLAIVGTIGLIFSAGTSALLIGAGIALIGGAALFVASGIKHDNFVKAYQEAYEKGLRDTIKDDIVDKIYHYRKDTPFGYVGDGEWGQDGASDDTIMWIGEAVSDLWFESSVNTNLRHKFVNDPTPTFLNSPSKIEFGNMLPIQTVKLAGRKYADSNAQRYPISSLEKHMCRKLLAHDITRDDSKYYIGMALGEYYEVNPDYLRKNKEKPLFHLPYEYDCCSECREKFPHRVYYSQQSFQEELSDNYRVFLPNNYRDIDGETGSITNIFKLNNNLFIHTEEALWQMPRNYQERVTDQITSFIGTGSYFEIPPQKILDSDNGFSAGCQHKFSSIKTPYGMFFMSANQNKYYQFNGELRPISSIGMKHWFDNNTELNVNSKYFKANKVNYPYSDNTSNRIGTGFISVYDSRKERIILTKKDFDLNVQNNDFILIPYKDTAILFRDFERTKKQYIDLGWEYLGIEENRLKFKKDKKVTKTVVKYEETVISGKPLKNDTDIIVYLDMSGSFDNRQRNKIVTTLIHWASNFKKNINEHWEGNLIFDINSKNSERWLSVVQDFFLDNRVAKHSNIIKIDSGSLVNLSQSAEFILIENNSAYKILNKNSGNFGVSMIGQEISKNQVFLTFSNECEDSSSDSQSSYYAYLETSQRCDLKKLNEIFFGLKPGKNHGTYIDQFKIDSDYYKKYYVNTVSNGGSVNLIAYPIVFTGDNIAVGNNACGEGGSFSNDATHYYSYNAFNNRMALQHIVASMEDDFFDMETFKKYFPKRNLGFSDMDWNLLPIPYSLKLNKTYPYSQSGNLKEYGCSVVTDKYWIIGENNPILTVEDFTEDLKPFLESKKEPDTVVIKEVIEEVEVLQSEYTFVEGEILQDYNLNNKSWTLSYSLDTQSWVSFHSYLPDFYLEFPNKFYSYTLNTNKNCFWEHNITGKYQTYYGTPQKHIIEYVSVSNPVITKIWNYIIFNTVAKVYNKDTNSYITVDNISFNRAVLYNSRQCSGEINLMPKSLTQDVNYLSKQITNLNNENISILEYNEQDFILNDFRDLRIRYDLPIWNNNINNTTNSYIDKVLNINTIDTNKKWVELESFRDKYLVVRLIFDNFAYNLTTNYITENIQQSEH